ncbi:hypothetical protein VTL71DRAFT_4716 [Oculimacula yallundae]|uniref:Uncharacterized protein n=1 Tax=Oculimacula yallundae TaxID=86028 RepID=A0ABR4C2T9_9HELO
MTGLLVSCPELVDLEIDMPLIAVLKHYQRPGILKQLAQARELRHLTLRMFFETVPMSTTVAKESNDVVYERVAVFMENLLGTKLGRPFEKLTIRYEGWGDQVPEELDEHGSLSYKPFIRIFSSRKHLDGMCSQDGVYQQWGSPRYYVS